MRASINKTGQLIVNSFVLILYCCPFVISSGTLLYWNYDRSMQTIEPIQNYILYIQKNDSSDEKSVLETSVVSEALVKYLNKQKTLGTLTNLEDKEKIKDVLTRRWEKDCQFILTLSLLPPIILGFGFAFKYNLTKPFHERAKGALSSFFMKYILGFVISLGWIYFFNPLGQGATAVHSYINAKNVISSNTAPYYISYLSQMKHTIAGFLGWYLHLLGYFFYRSYKNDFVSNAVYRHLFIKFLFVFGVALILSSVTTEESLLVLFLMGYFPLSAISMIKDYIKKVTNIGEVGLSLSELPGISRLQIIRLEEEEIDSISTLATYDMGKLKRMIPNESINHNLLDFWKDAAKLFTVIGLEKYKKIVSICTTSSYFLEKAKDSQFIKSLQEDCQIFNSDEIAVLLTKMA